MTYLVVGRAAIMSITGSQQSNHLVLCLLHRAAVSHEMPTDVSRHVCLPGQLCVKPWINQS